MKRLVALYGRAPMGEGTPLTESLTSFVGRLATARHLTSTDVFDRLVRPRLPEGMVCETARLSRFLASGAAVYDGLGKHAEAVAGALNRLTGPGQPFITYPAAMAAPDFLDAQRGAALRPEAMVCFLSRRMAGQRPGILGAPAVACCAGAPVSGASHAVFRGVSRMPGSPRPASANCPVRRSPRPASANCPVRRLPQVRALS